MVLRSNTRVTFLATGVFIILAFGLSSVFRGPLSHRTDIFAPRTEYVTKTPFFGTDKLSETDFHLIGGEPGRDGTNSRNGVSSDGGPPKQDTLTEEEATEDVEQQEEDLQSSPGFDDIDEPEEDAVAESTSSTSAIASTTLAYELPQNTSVLSTDPDLTNLTESEEEWSEFEKPYVENVQEGEDISYLLTPEQHEASNRNQRIEHNIIYSNMTKDGKWFLLDFINQGSYNPNIIPHPYKEDTWIMIAQRDKQYDDNTIWNTELVCEAHFRNNKFRCKQPPTILPIAATASDLCVGDIEFFNWQIGPHDARMFYGPDKPYVIYGSQSEYNCLGQWIQDLRRITDFAMQPVTNRTQRFYWPTNLQRPPPYREIEKNWFPFWDSNGTMYMHYDLSPRVYAKLNDDGSVGEDLAPLARAKDDVCMEKHMPKLNPTGLEWIHQGTNSLSITLCKRSDPDCVASDNNTFIFTIIQTKTFYMHGTYEPYSFLFKQTPPFEVHAISSIPFWYNGRGRPGTKWTDSTWKPKDQSEMVFTVSMSWKEPGMMYHGYLDDTIFIMFGIEDNHAGGIDVVAEELMKDLAIC